MGGQLFLLGGHFEKAAFSGGLYLCMWVEASLIYNLSINIYTRNWRIYKIWRFSWMLLRATENAVSGHIRSAGRYLPTPALQHWRRSCTLEWYSQVYGGGTKRFLYGLVKQKQLGKWELSNTERCQFLNGYFSEPYLWSWLFRQSLKECYLMCKPQKWDICIEFTVWHLATKCAAVKFVKLWISIHFSCK